MSAAWIFPGQGSLPPSAGAAWAGHPAWDLVEQAARVSGMDVARLLLDAGADELVDTANAQISTFVLSAVIATAARAEGFVPDHVAGHSLGEISALFAGGWLPYADACRLVAARGRAMRAATSQGDGAMAAIIGLEPDAVREVCEATTGDVWLANDNAPGQVVISGEAAAVEAAAALAVQRGARRPMPLNVDGAFHTPLMAPAQRFLDEALAECSFEVGDATPWANVDATPHSGPAEWPGLVSAQLCSPVRWRDEVAAMAAAGVDRFVELGPGTVLSGTVKRIAPGSSRAHVAQPGDLPALAEASDTN